MNLMMIVVVILVLALLLYGVSLIPLSNTARNLLYLVIVVLFILWLVTQAGVISV